MEKDWGNRNSLAKARVCAAGSPKARTQVSPESQRLTLPPNLTLSTQGDMRAQYSLGVMHHTGRTKPAASQADAEAFKFMKLAAQQVRSAATA